MTYKKFMKEGKNMKKVLSFALAVIMVFGSVPLAAFSNFNLNGLFPLSAITAEAATAVVITTCDANPGDNNAWLDIDSDRVEWTCSASAKSYRYTVVEVDKSGQKIASPLVELKLTTSKYFRLSSINGMNPSSIYKVWVGCYTDSSGNTILQGDGGCEAYFRTNSTTPTVTTGKASNIGDTYATLSGTLEKNGGASITDHGFVVSTSSSKLTLAKGDVYSLGSAGANKGTFTKKITDLSRAKTYYFKYYAQNENGVEYGDSALFTTNCSHSETDEKISTSNEVIYKSISSTQHQLKCYYDKYCTLCYQTVEKAYRYDTTTESHSFNSAGICEDCKYAKGCAHENQIKEYYDERYNITDSKTHEYVKYYKLVCYDCGIDVDTKVMWDTTTQNHSFLRNECTKCGYVKNQALSVTLTADSAKANVNTNFGATAQATGGAGGYQYTHSVFNEKNEELRYLSYSEVTRFSYSTTKPGKYYFKVTVKDADGTTATATSDMITVVCPHETYDTDKFRITSSLEYEQYNDSQHYSIWYYNWDCTVCNDRYKEHVTDAENKSLENHSYSSNSNVCKCCGYTNSTTYTINYDANGGIGAPASQTKKYNVTLKLSTVIPSKKGYTFLGWSTSATATSATYSAGGNYTKNSNCTLYAVWSSAVPKVIIDGTEIAPEYLRKEQTGVYAELYKLTSALNGSYTKNGNNATVRIYNENYGDYFRLFYTLPSNVSEGSTFNVEVYNETTADKFLTHGVYSDGMIFGNVDLLTRIGNMKRSTNYNEAIKCEYVKANATQEGFTDKTSTVSFSIRESASKPEISGSTTISFEQGWLVNDSITYNHGLAQFCSQFSMIGYSDCYGKAVNVNSKTQLKTALESVGFELVDINMQTGRDEVNYFIAARQGLDLKTGKVYDVIFVGLIGSYKDQWYSDFDPYGMESNDEQKLLVDGTTHRGFYHAQKYVYGKLYNYMYGKYKGNYPKDSIKIVLTGHSRGAAGANLIGKQLIDEGIYTSKDNIFTYAFATPNSALTMAGTEKKDYKGIFNIVNPEDFVTKVLPNDWGFARFGRTFKLPSCTNDTAYSSYKRSMQSEYGKIRKGQTYLSFKEGEKPTFDEVKAFNEIGNLYNFYYKEYNDVVYAGRGHAQIITTIPYNYFRDTLCRYCATDGDDKMCMAGAVLPHSKMDYLANYFYKYQNEFRMAHEMQTYCAYMLSMTESQIKEGEFGRKELSVSVNCPVDVDIYDKKTGELVGRIRNNVVDETIAAKENSVVMTVDGDSKSFWLPSNGDYKVVLTGNDDGTMDYIVRSVDSDTGETERINYFDVEVVKGVSMNSEFGPDNSTLEDFELEDESGTEIAPTEKLYEDGFNTIEIKVSADGDGFVTNNHNATKGDYVTVDATPNTSNLFLGWYNEKGELLTRNINYSFVAKENVSLTAKFTSFAIMTPSTTKISYGDSIILHADIKESLPTGSTIRWTADNDNFVYSASADGKTCTISPNKSGDTTFTVTVYDENGNVIGTDTQIMTSKAGFFDKIIAFFKKLFGLTKTIPQIYKAVF